MGEVKLLLSTPLARIIGKKEVEIDAPTLKDAFDVLTAEYGDQFKTKIFDNTGNPKRLIRIYVNGKDIRFLNHLKTPLNDGDEVLIIPAITGG